MRFNLTTSGLVFLLLAAGSISPLRADTNNDFQQWSLIFVNHHINEKWSANMQAENRLRDNASERDKRVYKPAGYYQRIRDANNLSNHVLRLQFLVDIKGLFPFFVND